MTPGVTEDIPSGVTTSDTDRAEPSHSFASRTRSDAISGERLQKNAQRSQFRETHPEGKARLISLSLLLRDNPDRHRKRRQGEPVRSPPPEPAAGDLA